MIKLSERLLSMAAYVGPGEAVADIGTDHGLLPIFLHEHGISNKLILCDVAEGPLEKARHNIREYAPAFSPDLRLGDGLIPLAPGEVDTVVIAGMGGELIMRILAEDPVKTKSFKKFILQPRTLPNKLRKFLFFNDFAIVDESLVRERGRICEVIVVTPLSAPAFTPRQKEEKAAAMERELAFEISPLLLAKKDPCLEAFLHKKIEKEQNIVSHIRANGRNVGYLKTEWAKKRVQAYKKILHRVEKDSRKD